MAETPMSHMQELSERATQLQAGTLTLRLELEEAKLRALRKSGGRLIVGHDAVVQSLRDAEAHLQLASERLYRMSIGQ